MSLRINAEVPDFSAETTQGNVSFHDWIGDGWAILFSHPKDFTPVCTTELGYMAGLMPEFQRRNCKIIGPSVDPVDNHSRWAKDIEETQGHVVTYPLITILRSGDAVVEFRPSGIKLDAVVLAKGPDLLGERAINRLTQRDVGAMIDRGRQRWYNRTRPACACRQAMRRRPRAAPRYASADS